MPSAISKSIKNKRSRRLSGQKRPLGNAIPIGIASAAKAGSVLTVVFDQMISLNGVPKYTTDVVGATAQTAVMTSPTTVAITFSAALTAATLVNIPYEDPGIRNVQGGYVSDSTFPVS